MLSASFLSVRAPSTQARLADMARTGPGPPTAIPTFVIVNSLLPQMSSPFFSSKGHSSLSDGGDA